MSCRVNGPAIQLDASDLYRADEPGPYPQYFVEYTGLVHRVDEVFESRVQNIPNILSSKRARPIGSMRRSSTQSRTDTNIKRLVC